MRCAAVIVEPVDARHPPDCPLHARRIARSGPGLGFTRLGAWVCAGVLGRRLDRLGRGKFLLEGRNLDLSALISTSRWPTSRSAFFRSRAEIGQLLFKGLRCGHRHCRRRGCH